ncbi:MAG: phospholipase [Burkholderiales bacterium]|nr:phospholipase [Burkholderiales bacterium]MDE2276372.1 phospholipase [Burkholderiales bacterium]
MQALQIYAGPRAQALLRERGLRACDVRVIPAAAGGPKGLALNPLDRFLFGHWLKDAPQVIHLPGASIGAWRLACACLPDADAALAQLAEDYITQQYEHRPGRAPTPAQVSLAFGRKLDERLGARAAEVLSHPRWRLHVFTSRGRHLLRRDGRWRTPLGYLAAFVSNAARRRALGLWLERVVFSDPRHPLPVPLADFRSRTVALTAQNLAPAILASCSIPFWLEAVHDVPGAPRGAYWDGGITDYHLHLDYAAIDDGLVLYPHFQGRIVPGWLDKPWPRRHRASPALANVVVLAPSREWLRTLPRGKLPDRSDFKAYGDDHVARQSAWRRVLAESRRLADEFAQQVAGGGAVQALPLP